MQGAFWCLTILVYCVRPLRKKDFKSKATYHHSKYLLQGIWKKQDSTTRTNAKSLLTHTTRKITRIFFSCNFHGDIFSNFFCRIRILLQTLITSVCLPKKNFKLRTRLIFFKGKKLELQYWKKHNFPGIWMGWKYLGTSCIGNRQRYWIIHSP